MRRTDRLALMWCRAARAGIAVSLLGLSIPASAGAQAAAEPAPAKAKAKPAAGAKAKPAAEPKAKPGADAKPAGKAKDKKAKGPKVDAKTQAALDQARKLLASSERDQVEAGIQSLGLLGGPAAVPPLVERIEAGLPPELLEAAVVTLMALAQPEAGPALYELSAHRRPEIRLRALEAISATQPPGAETALVAALSDSDPRVRSAAATALGELRAAGAMEKLFLALDRGNMEASGAIGKVVPAGEVSRLTGYLGQIPLHSLGAALGEVLQRKDVSEGAKLEIIARLEELGTPEVKGWLNDMIASAGEALGEKLNRAMLRAMQEIAE